MSVLISSYLYDFVSNPFKPGNSGVLVIFTFPFLSWVGITITVSPSKSAPDKRSATDFLIPTASILSTPIIFLAWAFLLFTVKIGISNVPPWGYLTNATLLPSLYCGANISSSFNELIGNITWNFCPGKAAAFKSAAAESQELANFSK